MKQCSFPSFFSYFISWSCKSQVKFSANRVSAQESVKKIWNGPKFSNFAMNSFFFFLKYLGVPLILSNTVHGSCKVYAVPPSSVFVDFPLLNAMFMLLVSCLFSMYIVAAKRKDGQFANLLSMLKILCWKNCCSLNFTFL